MAVDAWYPHLRQGGLFLLIGLAQLALDSSIFIGMTALGLPVVASSLIGRSSGAAIGFWLNGRYTFGKAKLDRSHAARFIIAWLLLTVLSTALISSIAAQLGLHAAWLAKPLVEAALAVASFVISRHWIYR